MERMVARIEVEIGVRCSAATINWRRRSFRCTNLAWFRVERSASWGLRNSGGKRYTGFRHVGFIVAHFYFHLYTFVSLNLFCLGLSEALEHSLQILLAFIIKKLQSSSKNSP